MECRLIKDSTLRKSSEEKLGGYEAEINKLETELKWSKTEGNKKELFGGGGNREFNPKEEGDAMLKAADQIQDKTAQSLKHTEQMVQLTKEVATATIEELRRQREQIKDITEEVMQLEDNLTRADKLIRTFGRRMATDKFIQCFACVNVLLLAGVIILTSCGLVSC